ncbi:acyl-CoA dehydrogenase family protein [Thermoplasma sp.]|uniref:acyl-CoA dehydrogenase family protein n=1 Tax=Thermoplasma sp. TaxID=1973142 RepID=UPI00128A618F|nr:acyl-CoA dehydrogenase family protein [Thermoplasma sp.]KAA8922251.1 MAG: acyl-CoA dehydrogenase [Thermoplasma sp.]
MDFELPKYIEDYRKKIREFAVLEFTDERRRYYDEHEKFPMEEMKKALSLKLVDFDDPWKLMVAIEELFRVDPGMGNSIISYSFGSEILKMYGSDFQKKKYLDPVLRGEKIMGLGVTEPVAGSDVAGIASRLSKNPKGGWILNGSKIFITNGMVADFFLILAKNDPPLSKKSHQNMTLSIVEPTMPGFSRVKMYGKLGVRATDTAQLNFDDIHIPDENVVGEPGKGFYYVMTFFDISRVYISAQSVGIAQGALDSLINRASADPDIASSESIQFAVAELSTRVDAARLLTYRAASLLFDFKPDPVYTSMAKYYSADTAVYATDVALRFLGLPASVTSLERLYRDAKIMEIWEGSSEVEKLVIYRTMMKKIGDKDGRGA